jgi:hypothetical protein
MTKIINLRGHAVLPPNCIYIGRKNPRFQEVGLGNPFHIKAGARGSILRDYERWLKAQDHILAVRKELLEYDFGCWCYPKPCHGEILAEVCGMDDATLELWKSTDIPCLDDAFRELTS